MKWQSFENKQKLEIYRNRNVTIDRKIKHISE